MASPALAHLTVRQGALPAPAERPLLRVVPVEQPSPWTTGYRVPNAKLAKKFGPMVAELEAYARQSGLRLGWITLTSRSKGGTARVLEDMKRCWEMARHRAALRNLPGFLVVFGTHARPHAHLLAVLPPALTLRSIRSAWKAGITKARLTGDADDVAGVGSYCAAQEGDASHKPAYRFRRFTYRAPPVGHLDSQGPTGTSVVAPALQVVPPPAAPRVGAGGHPLFGESRPEGRSAAPSWRPQADSARPQAGGAATGPEAGDEANCACPPCGNERQLRLVVSNPIPKMPMDTHDLPSVRADLYTGHEIELGMLHLRAHIPRDRTAATGVGGLVSTANMDVGLVEESLMRLLYAGQVKRRRDGRSFVYWASKTLPPALPAPVVIPGKLQHFRVPVFFGPR